MINLSFLKDRKVILIGIAVILVVITGALIFLKTNPISFKSFSLTKVFGMSDKQVAEKVIKYINDNKLAQVQASLVSFSKEYGLVKVKIKIGTQEFESYATKDGKLLFPSSMDMSPADEVKKDDNSSAKKITPAALKKSDTPILEAFIVSRCPYGLQMQRMMADAVKNIPSLGKYFKVEYIGSVSADGKTITAMHGDAEAKENLRQICIRDEQPAKYWDYISCQMKASGTETSCEQSTGVNSGALSACIADSTRGVAYAKKDFDNSKKYDASGSPTLILNGSSISEFDYGGRTSDAIKSVACAGFETQPSFCSTKLNTSNAAVSFSATYGSGSASSGNSGSNGANCEAAK